MFIVLQKSKQVKTRVDLKGKRVGSKNGKVSRHGICFKAFDFMPDLKVDGFMPVVIEHMTIMFCLMGFVLRRSTSCLI